MQTPTQNAITQKAHGSSKAVDHDASPDETIYAPEDGTIDSYQQRGSGTSDAGLALRMRGANGLHQFAHTSKSLVSVGQKVKRGQPIAIMGNTGYVRAINGDGSHLHWWIQKPDGSYVYPPDLINESFIKLNQGEAMSDKWDINNARQIAYSFWGRDGRGGRPNAIIGQCDDDLTKNHVGKADLSNSNITSAWDAPEAQNYRKDLDRVYAEAAKVPDLVKQLNAKPKEVIKEVVKEVPVEKIVEKIVEKPVEKIVEKEVVKEVPKVVGPTYYSVSDLTRALIQKGVEWFKAK